MPRSRAQRNRTKARKAKQQSAKPKTSRVMIAHQPPSGIGLALLAASVLRVARPDK